MKRLLLVLPLLCGLALGQEYDKERYEKDLKDYNENHQSALSLASKIQSKRLDIDIAMSTYAQNKVMPAEIEALESNILKLSDEAEHLFSDGYFSDCFESALEISNIFKADLDYERAVIDKNENSIRSANIMRYGVYTAYNTVFAQCLNNISTKPKQENYPLLKP